jgi:hypothetical protein
MFLWNLRLYSLMVAWTKVSEETRTSACAPRFPIFKRAYFMKNAVLTVVAEYGVIGIYRGFGCTCWITELAGNWFFWNVRQSTWHHIPEDRYLGIYDCENVKFNVLCILVQYLFKICPGGQVMWVFFLHCVPWIKCRNSKEKGFIFSISNFVRHILVINISQVISNM